VSRLHLRRRGEDELLGTLERALTPHRRPSLPVLVWEWRKDLALGLGIAALFVVVVRTSGIIWAVVGLSAALGALSPPWSARLRAFGCLLITPHRFRAGLYHARIQNRSGKRPVIIRVTSEPFGERIRLWCPAGISAEDIDDERDVLRAACWAADVRVTRDEQRSHLVTVDIIRRPDDVEPCDSDQDTAPCPWPQAGLNVGGGA
jgi:hypothetical protein